MSTTPVVVSTPQLSKTSLILLILNAALTGLAAVPVTAVPAAIAESFVQIVMAGLQAYQQETGQPIDLTKIPLETPAP
jgi:hypothetical protein